MSYLARLKQLDDDKFSHHTPDIDLPKPPKPPFDSFGSTDMGLYAKKMSDNDRQQSGECKSALRADRHEWKPGRCDRCAHISRFAGGNTCRIDNGLPKLFGLLHDAPEDRGASCARWQADTHHQKSIFDRADT